MPNRHSPSILKLCSLLSVGLVFLASGCGALGGETNNPKTVVIATHDSWAMSKSVLAEFKRQTGLTVKIQTNGDAGELTGKLVLTKGDPIADGVYGIDNTFATRAVDENVLAGFEPKHIPDSAAQFALPPGQGAEELTPVDFGDVCVNIDDTWFARHHLAPPTSLDDLVKPAYKNLFVTPGAASSSPGMAFLVATIGKYGAGWPSYWRTLMANGAKLTSGWTDAYEVDFTAGGGKGDRPIVLSYASSPPFTIPKGKKVPTTSALLNTCFRQVEYAGVLKGAKNPTGAEKFIDFMLTKEFQAALPENMYVFPVDLAVPLPPEWARWAKVAPHPIQMSPAEITAKRAEWLQDWRNIATQ